MDEQRPGRLILVAGTTTGVGKTWVAARVLTAMRARGLTVAARKPVQSYQEGDGPTDAEVLAEASGEEPTTVCPPHRWYELAMAPPMAASVLGREPFSIDDLKAELWWPPGVDLGIVESVGGPRSPLAEGGDTAVLAKALKPDETVLIGDAGLGVINAVVLSVAALLPPAPLVFLNQYEASSALHRKNAEWLREREGLQVVTEVECLVNRLS